MAIKIPANKFVEFLNNRCLAKDGYIMGATNATINYNYTGS